MHWFYYLVVVGWIEKYGVDDDDDDDDDTKNNKILNWLKAIKLKKNAMNKYTNFLQVDKLK